MKNFERAVQLREEGKSYRQIGKELGVPHSTVAYHLSRRKPQEKPQQFARVEDPILPGGTNPLEQIHMLPPGSKSGFVVPPYMQYSGLYRAGQNYYYPADLAIRDSRENARNMWNNLIVREPLQARLWAAAEQEWHIEPEDKTDAVQVEVARRLQRIIEGIPDFLKLRYSLLKSRWFGVYGVQLNYQWDANRQLSVRRWSEIHGDSLVFKMNSDEIGVYVVATNSIDNIPISTEAGFIGRVHKFDQSELRLDADGKPYQALSLNERQAVIVMSYDPQASDFLDPRGAGGVNGLGLRSTVYPVWLQMTEITGWMIDFLERFGTGITIYKFIRGNEASYNSARQLAESQDQAAAVMVPVDMASGQPIEGIERIEPSAVGLENVQSVIDFFASQIKMFIVGQPSTSEKVTAGLGSEIANVHENTFFRIVAFDCVDLQETLTRQLVRVIQDWSFPGTPPCKFVINYDKPDADKMIDNARKLWEMGIALDIDELRSIGGFTRPSKDSEIVQKMDVKQAGFGSNLSAGLSQQEVISPGM